MSQYIYDMSYCRNVTMTNMMYEMNNESLMFLV